MYDERGPSEGTRRYNLKKGEGFTRVSNDRIRKYLEERLIDRPKRRSDLGGPPVFDQEVQMTVDVGHRSTDLCNPSVINVTFLSLPSTGLTRTTYSVLRGVNPTQPLVGFIVNS